MSITYYKHVSFSIDVWEVFVLLSRLNDDWGWGRSQRSGESGLIPLMIMEDVVRWGVCVQVWTVT